jgi:uncharacterized membrane protein
MGTGFEILVLLHVLCAIGGFGAVAYNGLYTSLAARRPDGGTSAVLEVNRLVSGLAEMLIYAALLFGVGAVAASHSTIKFSSPWVSAAFGVYLVALGVLHGWIRPNQRKHLEVVKRLEAPPKPSTCGACGDCGDCGECEAPGTPQADSANPASRPVEGAPGSAIAGGAVDVAEAPPAPSSTAQDVADLRRYEKFVNAGWAGFNLLVVAAVYLMVFQPGGR